jgi:hypothetical protein
LKADLLETFGAKDDSRDDKDLRATSETVQRHARANGGTPAHSRAKPESNTHETFDDL